MPDEPGVRTGKPFVHLRDGHERGKTGELVDVGPLDAHLAPEPVELVLRYQADPTLIDDAPAGRHRLAFPIEAHFQFLNAAAQRDRAHPALHIVEVPDEELAFVGRDRTYFRSQHGYDHALAARSDLAGLLLFEPLRDEINRLHHGLQGRELRHLVSAVRDGKSERPCILGIQTAFRVLNRYVGNLPPMPGVFPDYPAPVVRKAGTERELTMMRRGMPPPPKFGGPPVTNIRNTSSPHWRGWMSSPGEQLL
jgi:hypothetical protein